MNYSKAMKLMLSPQIAISVQSKSVKRPFKKMRMK